MPLLYPSAAPAVCVRHHSQGGGEKVGGGGESCFWGLGVHAMPCHAMPPPPPHRKFSMVRPDIATSTWQENLIWEKEAKLSEAKQREELLTYFPFFIALWRASHSTRRCTGRGHGVGKVASTTPVLACGWNYYMDIDYGHRYRYIDTYIYIYIYIRFLPAEIIL